MTEFDERGAHATRATQGTPAGARDAASTADGTQRLLAGVLGGALLAYGLRQRSAAGVVLAAAASDLLYRSVRGQSLFGEAIAALAPDRTPGPHASGARARAAGAHAPETYARELSRAVTVRADAERLHRAWREPEMLERVMGHFADVRRVSESRAHWTVHAPLGRTLRWTTQVVEDRPGELLRWESLEGADVPNEGWVRFRPAPRDWGTEVHLHLHFDPPGGAVGRVLLDALGPAPEYALEHALRRFKSLVETGEMPTLRLNPTARAQDRLPHDAGRDVRPAADRPASRRS